MTKSNRPELNLVICHNDRDLKSLMVVTVKAVSFRAVSRTRQGELATKFFKHLSTDTVLISDIHVAYFLHVAVTMN